MIQENYISIIIPVYNAEAFLEETISSVLSSTYQNIELILVDDASDDSSGAICDRIADSYENVFVLHHKVNCGLSQSREDGLHIAKYDWISFVDHDDKISPKMYEYLMHNSKDADIVCVRGEERNLDEFGNISWDENEDIDPDVLSGVEACERIYGNHEDFGIITPLWGKCIRRDFLERVLEMALSQKELLKWTYFEDVFLGPIMFYHANRIVIRNSFLYAHRHMLTNLSSSLKPTLFHYETVEAGKLVLKFWQEKHLDSVYYKSITGYLLTVQRAWYQTVEFEKNKKVQECRENEIIDAFEEFYPVLKQVKVQSMSEWLKHLTMHLFHKNRSMWKYSVGHLWFRVIYSIIYR